MRQIILTILLFMILVVGFGCNPTMHNMKFDSSYSKNEIVKTKEEAVEIANYYLEQKADTNYYKDSVTVNQYDDGDYRISFKRIDLVMPSIILLYVREDDGCVSLIPLK
jgi:hypothetical protein